jgi:hypothetical protein
MSAASCCLSTKVRSATVQVELHQGLAEVQGDVVRCDAACLVDYVALQRCAALEHGHAGELQQEHLRRGLADLQAQHSCHSM